MIIHQIKQLSVEAYTITGHLESKLYDTNGFAVDIQAVFSIFIPISLSIGLYLQYIGDSGDWTIY